MILLSGVRQCKVDEKSKLLSSTATGFVAYVAVALVSIGLFVRYGRDFVTAEGFGASIAFQFLLVVWFANDAGSMYCVVSSDECMHGVIYLYTDIIMIALGSLVLIWCSAVFAGALEKLHATTTSFTPPEKDAATSVTSSCAAACCKCSLASARRNSREWGPWTTTVNSTLLARAATPRNGTISQRRDTLSARASKDNFSKKKKSYAVGESAKSKTWRCSECTTQNDPTSGDISSLSVV